jgi:hypothetical protein
VTRSAIAKPNTLDRIQLAQSIRAKHETAKKALIADGRSRAQQGGAVGVELHRLRTADQKVKDDLRRANFMNPWFACPLSIAAARILVGWVSPPVEVSVY